MPGHPSRPLREHSPLRRARKARNWTLERTVEEIDLRTSGGHSGVTPSMLSGWELGRHVTSIGHRAMLCEIFGQPPDALFAHQDEQLASGLAFPSIAHGFADPWRLCPLRTKPNRNTLVSVANLSSIS